MKYCILIIGLLFNINSLYSLEIDSTLINKRIEKAIEKIRQDSLFNNYLEKEYGNLISFQINDTIGCHFISFSTVQKLYPDSSKIFVYNRMKYLMNCPERIPEITYFRLSNKFKSVNNNYKMYIALLDINILMFLLVPINKDEDKKCIECYMLFNNDDKIIMFVSKKYNIQY